eukprot:2444359-Rhodomonas_salina.1
MIRLLRLLPPLPSPHSSSCIAPAPLPGPGGASSSSEARAASSSRCSFTARANVQTKSGVFMSSRLRTTHHI